MDCSDADLALDSVVEDDFGPDELMAIRHGTAHFYTNEGYNRFFWYPAIGGDWLTPAFWIDGVHDLDGAHTSSWWRTEIGNRVTSRLAVPSPVELDFQVDYGQAKDDTGTVHVQVVATEPIAFADLHLRVAVVESELEWNGKAYHQILRNYYPDRYGIPFTIAQGDTFSHSQEFVIHIFEKASWVVENCELVVFVQDDATYQILQAAHGPVLVPTPAAVTDLTVHLVKEDIRLDWTPVTEDAGGNPLAVDHYNVYRDTLASFDAGADPFAAVTSPPYIDVSGATGDPGKNYFYRVTAVTGYKESGQSADVGEFDRQTLVAK